MWLPIKLLFNEFYGQCFKPLNQISKQNIKLNSAAKVLVRVQSYLNKINMYWKYYDLLNKN